MMVYIFYTCLYAVDSLLFTSLQGEVQRYADRTSNHPLTVNALSFICLALEPNNND
jgi:hypothetical protein